MASDNDLLLMHNNGYSADAIARHFNLRADSVRGRVSRARKRAGNLIQDTPPDEWDKVLEELAQVRAQLKAMQDADASMYEPSARDDTDWDKWEAEYQRLRRLNRMIVVQTMNDMHIPDDDHQAVDLALAINADVQPDITILGSDAFDFDVLSLKYPRMYNRKRRDPFEEVRGRYDDIVSELREGNPRGTLIALGDNHAQVRGENFINTLIPIFGDRITADYNELIRSQNRVLWLGWQQEVYLHKAIFEHGKKAGANPAMANFKSHGESFTDISGHAHRWQTIVTIKQHWMQEQRRMLYYPLMSAVTGCLQHVPPHYITDTKAINSTQGCAVVHVNMHGLDTHVQNILFHPREDGSLVAVLGKQVYTQQAAVSAVRKAG